ncbi:hypothetical protein [Streptomyces avidinii]|uniref:Secreted protein n=1 Tax=Streptomyces avidinii TaxID=1895 RepID=A0ABS4KYP3_STRAV|nr:hypothetical protein [Streptomyces avidinii]MBP2035123.1 hypothetical protein [Streptomyces avidinii]GGY91373.1 hypothetical protein GCM10010343_16070 [Streptomyces avidinii]
MRLKSSLVATAAALATVVTPLIASPAAAASGTEATVSTNSYYGRMAIGWRLNPYRLDPIQITAQDRATDGYVVGIRLITNGENGHKVWSMRTVPSGRTSASWSTHLQAGWIDNAYFEVCKIGAGSGVIASCESSAVTHNPFDDSSM